MPRADEYLKKRNLSEISKFVDTPRLLWISRPIHVIERKRGRAVVVKKHRHIDVLIDRYTGTRSVRSQLSPEKMARFDELCESRDCEKIDAPTTCTEKQRRIMLVAWAKVIGVFGGNQSGKTTTAAEWLVSRILTRGGRGRRFLWVSYTYSISSNRFGNLFQRHFLSDYGFFHIFFHI